MTPIHVTSTLVSLALGLSAHPAQATPRPYATLHGHRPASHVAIVVERANQAARVMPAEATFANAEQVYNFTGGALFQVYTTQGKVTDIVLEPGEHLVGTGPVAAGDTARWIIGTTESGLGEARQIHILVKPTLPGLATNLVVNSDRRTYHIELRALASTYMASVSWRYASDALVAVHASPEANPGTAQAPLAVAGGIDPARLNFAYRLEGDNVSWRPLRCFDDGMKVYIEMPAGAQTELPPLFLLGADGKAELVNYRVSGRFLVVDHLLQQAELRLGEKGHQKVVRIRHLAGPLS